MGGRGATSGGSSSGGSKPSLTSWGPTDSQMDRMRAGVRGYQVDGRSITSMVSPSESDIKSALESATAGQRDKVIRIATARQAEETPNWPTGNYGMAEFNDGSVLVIAPRPRRTGTQVLSRDRNHMYDASTGYSGRASYNFGATPGERPTRANTLPPSLWKKYKQY